MPTSPLPNWLIGQLPYISESNDQRFFPWKRIWDSDRYSRWPVMNRCAKRFRETGLSRGSVAELFKKAVDKVQLREDAMVSALLWGAISTGGQTGDRLSVVLNQGTELLQRGFASAHKHLMNDDSLKVAYRAFEIDGDVRIPEVGPAYFTKILYFMGVAIEMEVTPLILDKWSGNAYAMLLLDAMQDDKVKSNFDITRINTKFRFLPIRPSAELYATYVSDMNAWANALRLNAAIMEEWLFGYDLRTKKGRLVGNPRLLIWARLQELLTPLN